jgi:hypothetical protein
MSVAPTPRPLALTAAAKRKEPGAVRAPACLPAQSEQVATALLLAHRSRMALIRRAGKSRAKAACMLVCVCVSVKKRARRPLLLALLCVATCPHRARRHPLSPPLTLRALQRAALCLGHSIQQPVLVSL